jgi:predicted nucleic acid-binding protein
VPVARFTALLDASVLYSMVISDLMLETARSGMFRARWTEHIHDEWQRSLIANRPDLDPLAVRRRRDAMNAAISDAVITGYEAHIASLTLSDPDDRHVLAAAIAGAADVIVTLNTKDFPTEALEPYGLEVQHPDTFLIRQRSLNGQHFVECARRCRRRLRNPEVSVGAYLDNLRKAGLVLLSAELASVQGLL